MVCYQKVSSLVKCNSNWSHIKNSNWSKTKKKGWRPHHIVECRYWPWIIIQQEWITNCIVRIFCHQHPHIGNNLHKNSKMENLNIICFRLMFVISWKMKTYHSAWWQRWLGPSLSNGIHKNLHPRTHYACHTCHPSTLYWSDRAAVY